MNDMNMFENMGQQFSGSAFEGTPISQLMGDNNQMGGQMGGQINGNFGNFPPQGNRPQLSNNDMQRPNIMFQQPSNNIRNLVNDINQRIVNDYDSIQDNVSFDLSSRDSNKKQFIKKIKQLEKNTTETDSEEEEKKKKLKKLKKRKEKKNKHNKKDESTEENSDYIAFYNFGKHLSNDSKEVLLLVFLYCFLSLGFVKKTVGGYITYLNPNETGKYQYIGVIIYGFLLSILFISLKKILI
jgi:hypothetical protein